MPCYPNSNKYLNFGLGRSLPTAGEPQICQSSHKGDKVAPHSIKPAEGDGSILTVHRMEVLESESPPA